MKNIYDLLRQKEDQLRLLGKQVEALRVAAQLISEEDRLMDRSPGDTKLSQPQMVREVLREKGQPMHVAKIADAIKEKYGKKLKTNYLAPVIYRNMKIGKLFYKVEGKPNTFGLIEWQAGRSPALPLEGQRATQ